MSRMHMIRIHVTIYGRVQGVYFRMETKQTAERYGVSGWVKNREDGTVEAVFEGDEDRVSAVLKWCHQGPPASRVDQVITEREDYTGEFKNFKVVY